jgi:hypothetical protein
MAPWWKRLLYSFVSWVIVALLSGPLFVIAEMVGSHLSRAIAVPEVAASIAFITGMVFILSFPGWLLAIPIVLAVRNVKGWRFWMYFALGSSIGPAWILGMGLYFWLVSPHHSGFSPGPIDLYYRAVAVSSLTTLIYLLQLRRAQPVAAMGDAEAEGESGNYHF